MSTLEDNTKLNSIREELVKRREIKDSPFMVITINGKSFGCLGKFRLTEEQDTAEKAEKLVKAMTWNNIISVMMIIIEQSESIKNLIEEKNAN